MDLNDFIAYVKKKEGGLSRHPNDSASKNPCPTPYDGKTGWHTNKGITYTAWVKHFGTDQDQRFYEMSDEDWFDIFNDSYYSRVRGLDYDCPSIGFAVTAFAWGSGRKRAALTLQQAINNLHPNKVVEDGIIGDKTIAAANECDPQELFDELVALRAVFFYLIGRGKNAVFLKGWLNSLERFAKEFRP